jgi:hypothetical protein
MNVISVFVTVRNKYFTILNKESIFTKQVYWMCTIRFIIHCYVGNHYIDDRGDSVVGVATSYE